MGSRSTLLTKEEWRERRDGPHRLELAGGSHRLAGMFQAEGGRGTYNPITDRIQRVQKEERDKEPDTQTGGSESIQNSYKEI